MLVRIVLFLGLALVVFAGGAAGWQYWQTHRGTPTATAPAPEVRAGPFAAMAGAPAPQDAAVPEQDWLISPGGGLVEQAEAAGFLKQDRFVEGREVQIVLRLPLTTLLAAGERLPDAVFAGVFADIRAPILALDLCRPLLADWASGCRVILARAVKDSFDPATGTAEFRFRLAFTQKPGPLPLPDLATVIHHADWVNPDATGPDLAAATPQEALTALVAAAGQVCAESEAAGRPCRLQSLSLSWEGPGASSSSVRFGWLAAMPKGMFPAPPLF
ncbi:hypothetical protein [Neotabrizicola sp. VNH66]|uniref:hypothetical protein n=1 Tax=Neotabrizicola sp. VNH66 TaxID=3400918 RepID=UPI003BFEAC5E